MDETAETPSAAEELAETLRRLEHKVEALHEELEEKRRLLQTAEMKQLLDIERMRFTEEVQGEILGWMRRRFWWVVVIVSLVSIFGVRFLIEATANKQVFDQIIGTTTSVVSDLEALRNESREAVAAFDLRRKSFEMRLNELEPTFAGLSAVPMLERRVQEQQEWDNAIADWVFWTKIEVANERAKLMATLREGNPDLVWPASVRTREELSRLRDDKVIVYVTRRPYQTYAERLKLGDDTRDKFIEYGYFAETWVAGAREVKDANGVERSIREDLASAAQALGVPADSIAQKCQAYCLILDSRAEDEPAAPVERVSATGPETDGRAKFGAPAGEDRLRQVETEILSGVLPNRSPARVSAEFDLTDYIANIRDYSKAFPATRPVADERAMVVILGALN